MPELRKLKNSKNSIGTTATR